jgi:subtilisin family serine protease
MKGWGITLAATAFATAALAGHAGASAGDATSTPTGRALVSVEAPAVPTGDSRAAAAGRARARAISGDLLRDVTRRNDLRIGARSPAGGFIAVELGDDSVEELRRRLADDPAVSSVRVEQRAQYRLNPNDPAFLYRDPNAPLGDFAQWNLAFAGFPRAWELGNGEGGEVAVLDSGAYAAHPDLAGRIGGSINCAAVTCVGVDVTDTNGHGTHVSGLACADSDSGYGIASGGFDCSLYEVKLDAMLSYTSIINSIYAAADRGSDAINMSFGGGGPSLALKDALDYAWARGSVPVVAGANEPTPGAGNNYPAQYVQPEGSGPNIDAGHGLVVTSTKHSGARSAFAQRTAGVSVAAYGSASDAISGGQQGILSTWPPETPEPEIDTVFENENPPAPVRTTLFGDNRYAYLAGTSMAAPQVAGLVALMRAARPGISAARVVRLAKLTASGCGSYGEGLGWGRINADVAVGAALDRDMDPPASQVRSARASRRARSADRGRVRVKVRLKRFDTSCSKELPVAGLKSVRVFASVGGGPYKRVRKTPAKSFVFRARRGKRYRFYSVASDRAGNHEHAPAEPDAKVKT